MSGLAKGLFVFLILVVALSYIVYRQDVTVIDTKKDAYISTIRAASQVATREIMNVMDVNFIYDGTKREAKDIPIDMNALKSFNRTLDRILQTQKDGKLKDVSRLNIVMTGFVTYDYVVGVVYEGGVLLDDDQVFSGSYLMPGDYSVHVVSPQLPSEINDKIWQFTLGDKVIIGNTDYILDGNFIKLNITDAGTDISSFLSSVGFLTGKDLANYVVMSKIDEYLNNYSGASFNKVASNIGSSILINLGKTNYSENKTNYTTKASVISGPGMFAIVDVYTGKAGNESLYERIASFGGSELRELSEWE